MSKLVNVNNFAVLCWGSLWSEGTCLWVQFARRRNVGCIEAVSHKNGRNGGKITSPSSSSSFLVIVAFNFTEHWSRLCVLLSLVHSLFVIQPREKSSSVEKESTTKSGQSSQVCMMARWDEFSSSLLAIQEGRQKFKWHKSLRTYFTFIFTFVLL